MEERLERIEKKLGTLATKEDLATLATKEEMEEGFAKQLRLHYQTFQVLEAVAAKIGLKARPRTPASQTIPDLPVAAKPDEG